jgi:PAS domain S-box-containing protein
MKPGDRHDLAREVAASEERFRLLVEGTREYAIFMLFPDGRVASWNSGAERIKGYRADEIIGQHFSRFYTPEDQATQKPARALEVATAEGKFEDEGWRVRKDGTRFLASVVITALRDESGGIRGFGKVTRDITERRQAEETARRLEAEAAARQAAEASAREIERQREELRVTLASIGDAVITTDPAGRITMLNPVAERLTGWSDPEARGQPLASVFRIVNELTRQTVEDPVAKVLAAGTTVGLANHTILIARNGAEYPIDDSAAPIRDQGGNLVGVVLIFRDITARRLMERETEERLISEERLRIATQAGKVGVWEWDVERNHVTWTDAVYAIHGLRREEFDGTVDGFSRLIHPDDAMRVRQAIEGALVGLAPYALEFRIVRPTGEIAWIHTSATVQHRGGVPVRMIGATVDITQQQRTAEELREAHNRKDEFLATLSHELRNPLAPIRNAVEILMNNPTPDRELAWSRSVIDRQVQHMTRLLEDLLDVSRISRGALELRRVVVDLGEVIESALEASRPLIEESRHELTVRVEPGRARLYGDPVRLAQVFSNLLNNAARYTEAGGRIELLAEPVGDSVVVTVRDSGIGIPPDMLPRVFEMFVQGSPSWERARSGLGIGLSLSRGIVELHGGSIEARSPGPGQGAEFIVRLPVARSEMPAQADTRPEPEAARKARRVLVADDLRDSADTLAMLLRLHGHEVQTAYDGEEAVARAREFRPEVILLDLGMPRMGGDLACRVIREQPWGREMHVIALTGWGQESDRRRTEEAGFDEHLVKPVDPALLIDLLATLSPRNSPAGRVADR